MSTHVPASRTCWLFCCATLIAAVALPPPGHGQEFVEIASRTTGSPPKITVQMWVVEVSTDKLRNLGFAWTTIRSQQEFTTHSIDSAAALGDALKGANAEEFLGFLRALEQNNLSRMLAEPTIATVSDRKASLAIGEQLKLDVTPTAIDDKHVQLQYRLEVGGGSSAEAVAPSAPLASGSTAPLVRPTAASSKPLVAGSTVQVEVGKPCLVSQTRSQWQTPSGKRRQIETLLLVRADYTPANVVVK